MRMWEQWVSDVKLPELYQIASLYSDDKLTLIFEDKEKTKKISIVFDGFLTARESEEGIVMRTVEDWHAYCELNKIEGSIFTLKDSNYLDWFKKENGDEYNSDIIKHYIILSYDVISEVLTKFAPKVEIIHENN